MDIATYYIYKSGVLIYVNIMMSAVELAGPDYIGIPVHLHYSTTTSYFDLA